MSLTLQHAQIYDEITGQYIIVFHFSLCAEFSDSTDELLRMLISRRHYIIQIHERLLLGINFSCKKVLFKYMTMCQLLTQACSARTLPKDMTFIKLIPKSETTLHMFFAAT